MTSQPRSGPGSDILTRLSLAIHAGIHQVPPWADFLALLKSLGCPAAIVLDLPDGSRSVLGSDLPPAVSEAACAGNGKVNGALAIPFGGDGCRAWLVADAHQAPRDIADLLPALAQHLTTALQTLKILEERRVALLTNRRILDRLDIGIVALRADGRVLGSGPHARRIMRSVEGIAVRHGKIYLADQRLNRELSAAIRHCLADAHAEPRALADVGEAALELLLVRAPGIRVYSAEAPAAIIYLHRPNARPLAAAALPDRLRELFDLAPLEGQIAALLAQGMSVQEVAAALAITVNTARSYLKSLFAKTGVHRQAELVRLILRSIGTIG